MMTQSTYLPFKTLLSVTLKPGLLNRLLLGALLCGFLATASLAQTNDVIKSRSPNLETEFVTEFDKWMLQAYEGDRDAQFKIGVLFTNEQFKEPDYEQALYWYKQVARQGHALAQYNLGHQYLTGVGVSRNEIAAMQWWLKAADQDHTLAQFNVGRAYYLGIDLVKDLDQSRFWFERATKNKEPKSTVTLEQLGWAKRGKYKRPSPTQGFDAATASVSHRTASLPTASLPTASLPSTQAGSNQRQAPPTERNTGATIPAKQPEAVHSIAVYTAPSVRSVLIDTLDSHTQLAVESRTDEWMSVSAESGFPVWVHTNFMTVANDIGSVTGTGVNARSVPEVSRRTVVGKLENGELLDIIQQSGDWFRVMSPNRFKAWVKIADYERVSNYGDQEAETGSRQQTVQPSAKLGGGDNEWLFKQSPNDYTLLLASFDEVATVAQFTARKEFKNNPNLRRFTSYGSGIEWTYFLYGAYTDTEKAEPSRNSLAQKRAWIRNFGQLQQTRCVAWKKQIPAPRTLNEYCTQ